MISIMRNQWSAALFVLLVVYGQHLLAADPGKLIVKLDTSSVKISPTLYGLMTEEINHAYDGGLYAELIQNRAFNDAVRVGQEPDPIHPSHWNVVKSGEASGSMLLDPANPATAALPMSLRVTMDGGKGQIGVANDGYWGIPVKPHTQYQVSFFARAMPELKQPLTVALESSDGKTVYASETAAGIGADWKKYHAVLNVKDAAESTKNRFVIWAPAGSKGSLWLSLVSLFPPTFNNRPNGLRADLMELMGGLKPAFLRFPGGNYLEGNTIAERFDWKTTIGPIEDRPGHICPWGYRSTDGLGLLEFLTWCEDLHMQPVLAVYAGYSLQQQRVAAGADLQPFVNDALDEIDYVTGGPETVWGARRVKDGHAEPFQLTYVEVGNEDNFDNVPRSYEKRFAQFFDAIKATHPKLQVIATMPVHDRKPDLVDDHYYRSAVGMERDVTHYDAQDSNGYPKYPRSGPKIFVGEWATTEGKPTPTLQAALGDAAWMTGMERNSDVILISCYAPLLVNVNQGASQWGTNLIGYDARGSFGSPSYYAQKMFSENRGDRVVPVKLEVAAGKPAEPPMPRGQIGVGTWATQSEYKDMKVTVGDQVVFPSNPPDSQAWQPGAGEWNWDGGTLKQSSDDTNCRDTAGDPKWADFVYTLKARKISGNEGFLIMFHVVDEDNWLWWNIGGWNNTRTVIQKTEHGASRELGPAKDVKVDLDRWYDIKIETKGRQIRCYLDGELLSDVVDEPEEPAPPMYATASRDDATEDIILKVVNVDPKSRSMDIELQGIDRVAKTAKLEVLTGQPEDVNSLENPRRVAPVKSTIDVSGTNFNHVFPSSSLSVMRLKTR